MLSFLSPVAESFDKGAQKYDASAQVQRQAADLLAAELICLKPNLPDGAVLEIGCGTGLFTRHLIRLCAEREVTASDISSEMLKACQSNVPKGCSFVLLDADEAHLASKFALIASAFSAQWFKQLDGTLDKLMNLLVPGGCLLFSVPTEDSFPEWKSMCARSGVLFTGNQLPAKQDFLTFAQQRGFASNFWSKRIRFDYSSSLAFFKSLKDLGATTKIQAKRDDNQLVAYSAQLRHLIKFWDREAGASVPLTYDVLIGYLRKE
jgi:malonyl-CoA O-methyltransferase